MAEGIPIITHESHKKYYEEQIFKNPHSLNPDRLARAPRAPILETMKDKRVLSDAVDMKSRKTFTRVHIGFVNVNADKAKCALVAASRG